MVFCGWSAVDAINNICDVNLDTISNLFRARFTKNLGRFGLVITLSLCALTFSLAVVTRNFLVIVFIFLGFGAGVLYSVPPFRLRQTIYKPAVNFCVGAFPILIAAAFASRFSENVWALVFLFGSPTAVYSLWGDFASLVESRCWGKNYSDCTGPQARILCHHCKWLLFFSAHGPRGSDVSIEHSLLPCTIFLGNLPLHSGR